MNSTNKSALSFILSYRELNDNLSPSMRELAAHLGITVASVQYVRDSLEKEGYIKKRRKGIPRSIIPTGKQE